MADLITDFAALVEGGNTPEIYQTWAAIGLVAGALERRVWMTSNKGPAFPNLYTLLVGPPGSGKFVIEIVRELWQDTVEPGTDIKAFSVSPDNLTKASILDFLAESRKVKIIPGASPIEYRSVLVAAEEFGSFLHAYDMEFIHLLNALYNNKAFYSEWRRTSTVKRLELEFPQLNIIGGAQPAYFAGTFPEEAWSTGLARRIVMVYSDNESIVDLFAPVADKSSVKRQLLDQLGWLSALWGEMRFGSEALAAFTKWHMAGGLPKPTHSRLESYNRNRSLTIIKLCMISRAAQMGHRRPSPAEFTIQLFDFQRAVGWLLEAEARMPDIFRAMRGISDASIMEEVHRFVFKWYNSNKQSPVPKTLIMQFLIPRVPSEKLERIFVGMVSAGLLEYVGNDAYVPRPMVGFVGV